MTRDPDLLTRHEAARLTGMTVWGIDYHRKVGHLQWLTNEMGRVRISRKEVTRFINAQKVFKRAS